MLVISRVVLPHVCWPLVAVHLEVEPAGVTDRGAQRVPPPQRGLRGLAVGAPSVRVDQQLPAVGLRKYFSQTKIVQSENIYTREINVKSKLNLEN